MYIEYSNGKYTKNGSILSLFRDVSSIRSFSSGIKFSRRNIKNLRHTIREIRGSNSAINFESALFTQLHKFISGDYVGHVSFSYEMRVSNSSFEGEVSAKFVEENNMFTAQFESSYTSARKIREMIRDILYFTLQYNIEINCFSLKSSKKPECLVLSGDGRLDIPLEIIESSENHSLITSFPINNPLDRLLF